MECVSDYKKLKELDKGIKSYEKRFEQLINEVTVIKALLSVCKKAEWLK